MSETFTPSPPPPAAVAGYARAAGVSALIAAVAAVLVPNVGVLWFTPLAMILGIIAIKGGEKGYGIAVLVIVSVNMVITPTFLLNLGPRFTLSGTDVNQMVTYIDIFGVLGMILMLVSGRVWTTVAAVVIGLIGVGIYGQISKPSISPPDRTAVGSNPVLPPVEPASGPAGLATRAMKSPPPTLRQVGAECLVIGCGEGGKQYPLIKRSAAIHQLPDTSSPTIGSVGMGAALDFDDVAMVTLNPQVYETTDSSPLIPADPYTVRAFGRGERIFVYGNIRSANCTTAWANGYLYGYYDPPGPRPRDMPCFRLPPRVRVVEAGYWEWWVRVSTPTGLKGWLRIDRDVSISAHRGGIDLKELLYGEWVGAGVVLRASGGEWSFADPGNRPAYSLDSAGSRTTGIWWVDATKMYSHSAAASDTTAWEVEPISFDQIKVRPLPSAQWLVLNRRVPDASGTWTNNSGTCIDVGHPQPDRTLVVAVRGCAADRRSEAARLVLSRYDEFQYIDKQQPGLQIVAMTIGIDSVFLQPRTVFGVNDTSGVERTFNRVFVRPR